MGVNGNTRYSAGLKPVSQGRKGNKKYEYFRTKEEQFAVQYSGPDRSVRGRASANHDLRPCSILYRGPIRALVIDRQGGTFKRAKGARAGNRSQMVQKFIRELQGHPIFPWLNLPRRAATTFYRYIGPHLGIWLRWLGASREDTNFTYDLTDINRTNMTASLAFALGRSVDEIESYFHEVEQDDELLTHIKNMTATSARRMRADTEVRFGRRVAWYATVRALKPKVVIETGVDKGLGSVVLAAALLRNREKGHAGVYYGTDINPAAGYLLSGKYAAAGQILYGDSIASLEAMTGQIDLFINDSDHSADYEAREYVTVAPKMSPHGMMIGDNAHATTKLAEFSRASGRRFAFIAEQPKAHWHPGCGIGLSLPPKS